MSQYTEQVLACLADDKQMGKFALESFDKDFPAKFLAGNKKYLTPLTRKDCIKNAKEEVLDLWAYLSALEEQQRVIKMVLERQALGSMPPAIALDCIAAVLSYQPNGEVK